MKLLVVYPTITNWFFRNYLPIVLNQQSLSISLKHNPNISSNLSIEHQLLSLSTSFPQLFQKISAFVNTRIDWNETLESHMFKANLLGFKKEEVKVENLEIEVDRVLQISGERTVEKEDKNDTWHRVECNSGKFLRRCRLPENVKMVQVKASMENVVLIGAKLPDVKAVEISG